jgi:hypothetical protein
VTIFFLKKQENESILFIEIEGVACTTHTDTHTHTQMLVGQVINEKRDD